MDEVMLTRVDELDLLVLIRALVPWCIALVLSLQENIMEADGEIPKSHNSHRRKSSYYSNLLSYLELIKNESLGEYAEHIPQKILCKILACLESRVSNDRIQPSPVADDHSVTLAYEWVQQYKPANSPRLRSLYHRWCDIFPGKTYLGAFGKEVKLEANDLQEQGAILSLFNNISHDLRLWKSSILENELSLGRLYSSLLLPENPTDPALLTRQYQALCAHDNCASTLSQSHNTVMLRLDPCRNVGPSPNAGPGFSLLCSTGHSERPWREVELWIGNVRYVLISNFWDCKGYL